VISAGEENPYGHPNPQLLARRFETGVPYVGNGNAAIHIFTDGKSWKSAASCPAPT